MLACDFVTCLARLTCAFLETLGVATGNVLATMGSGSSTRMTQWHQHQISNAFEATNGQVVPISAWTKPERYGLYEHCLCLIVLVISMVIDVCLNLQQMVSQ